MVYRMIRHASCCPMQLYWPAFIVRLDTRILVNDILTNAEWNMGRTIAHHGRSCAPSFWDEPRAILKAVLTYTIRLS